MLQLVRSQRACLERIRSAVKWTRGIVLLIGSAGQGKSTVVRGLLLGSPFLTLQLDGKLIADRHDAVLRLIGLIGLRPDGSDVNMLARMQTKRALSTAHGIPEIVVEDSHCLTDDVLELFFELSEGEYGRRWSVLLIGEAYVLKRLLALEPFSVLPSIVRLPAWDQKDLESGITTIQPDVASGIGESIFSGTLSQTPKHLLRSLMQGAPSASGSDADMSEVSSTKLVRPRLFRMVVMLVALLLLAGILIVSLNLSGAGPREENPSHIPINIKP